MTSMFMFIFLLLSFSHLCAVILQENKEELTSANQGRLLITTYVFIIENENRKTYDCGKQSTMYTIIHQKNTLTTVRRLEAILDSQSN